MKHSSFLKSVAVLSLGGLAAKAIGAIYRIPLANVLGGYGTGLYQMAYPLFVLLLTFSSAGIPSAFSRVIARETVRGRDGADTVRAAIKIFSIVGFVGMVVMMLLSDGMSRMQGEEGLRWCYLALAPSVFFVAVIAVLRGYFQGKNNMSPTAISEILEQAIKAGVGILFALRFRDEPHLAAALTLLAVSVSELVALAYLYMRYRREGRRRTLTARSASGTVIFLSAISVMASVAILPLSQFYDSIVVVRLLSRYTARSVALYGLFTGGAVALVNLPATLSYGLSAAVVPAVSRAFARGDYEEGRRRAMYALGLTLLLAVPCALGLFFLAKPIVSLLYGGLSAEDGAMLVKLIRLLSVSAATLAGVQTLSACLTGMGKAKYGALSMLFAVILKMLLEWLLVARPSLSIAGAAISANACYLVAFLMNLFYTVKKTKSEKMQYDYGRGDGRECGGSYKARA